MTPAGGGIRLGADCQMCAASPPSIATDRRLVSSGLNVTSKQGGPDGGDRLSWEQGVRREPLEVLMQRLKPAVDPPAGVDLPGFHHLAPFNLGVVG